MPTEDPGDPYLTRALATRACDGDAESFRVLYERLAPALHVWGEVRIRDELRVVIDPQDLVQEVWCRAWRSMPEFDPQTTPFRFWVFRIAKNVLLEATRRKRSGGAGAGSTTRLVALQGVPEDATAVSQRVARDEGCRKLHEWVAGLEDADRELVVHCGLEGQSHAEVSRKMDLERETVSKRWQRLKLRLQEQGLPRELWLALES